MARPRQADFPRPRAAVSEMIERVSASWMQLTSCIRALAWSDVRHMLTRWEIGGVSARETCNEVSSSSIGVDPPATGVSDRACEELTSRHVSTTGQLTKGSYPLHGKNVEFIIHDKTLTTVRQREDETLVEPANDVLMRFRPEPVVDVHRHRE